jgi:hypothetical protein
MVDHRGAPVLPKPFKLLPFVMTTEESLETEGVVNIFEATLIG